MVQKSVIGWNVSSLSGYWVIKNRDRFLADLFGLQ